MLKLLFIENNGLKKIFEGKNTEQTYEFLQNGFLIMCPGDFLSKIIIKMLGLFNIGIWFGDDVEPGRVFFVKADFNVENDGEEAWGIDIYDLESALLQNG